MYIVWTEQTINYKHRTPLQQLRDKVRERRTLAYHSNQEINNSRIN